MSAPSSDERVVLNEGRFARFEAIQWWDQALLRSARVLVVGAGAIGNEVIKNLAMLGIGNLVITDMDRIEASNLTRSVLFRESDEGKFKAECAANAARGIYPGLKVQPLVGNILSDLGLGVFRWAQVVIGALDNREARVHVNASCAKVGRPWIDGGIEVLGGIVRGFAPPETACYECTMSQVDWDLINKRRSCSLLARHAISQGGTPTTSTTASVIGAIQAQEVIKMLHGTGDVLLGRGFLFDGRSHQSYTVQYPRNPDCGWHEPPPPIEALEDATADTTLRELWRHGEAMLGGLDAIDFEREIVRRLSCGACGTSEEILEPVERLAPERIPCKTCGAERVPEFVHTLSAGDALLDRTVREVGLPRWDVLWVRRGERCVGLELAGDRAAVLPLLAPTRD